ncbi:MAG: hypothetical protein CVU26_09385, partial [Betaproteobacteria bacterium HGW-Betaproteobacteria-2]
PNQVNELTRLDISIFFDGNRSHMQMHLSRCKATAFGAPRWSQNAAPTHPPSIGRMRPQVGAMAAETSTQGSQQSL